MSRVRLGLNTRFCSALWVGPVRRPFRRLVRPWLETRSTIAFGALRGKYFPRGGAERLGIYEVQVQTALLRSLGEGAVFYDVGANWGFFTLLASSIVGKTGMVYAFEPLPENARVIRDVIEANYVTNAHLIEAAISNGEGEVDLHVDAANYTSTPSLVAGTRSQRIRVNSVTLNGFTASHRRPDLIKIDVEGAECLVLEGAGDLLRDASIAWLLEIHSLSLHREIDAILRNAGREQSALPGCRRGRKYPLHILVPARASGGSITGAVK